MKQLLLLSSIFAFAVSAQAATVATNFNGFVGTLKTAEGDEQIHVAITPDGKIGVTGSKFVSQEPVEPTVVKDDRPEDGDLFLQINKSIQLIVGSGDTLDGVIEYRLKVGAQAIPLKPSVGFILKSKVSLAPVAKFVCQKGWIDCMPGTGESSKYCSQEYSDWAEKNCGGRPQIAE